LSIPFLNFFEVFLRLFQLSVCNRFRDSFYMITPSHSFVNTFLKIFGIL